MWQQVLYIFTTIASHILDIPTATYPGVQLVDMVAVVNITDTHAHIFPISHMR